MLIELCCQVCRKHYNCTTGNTKIYGPIINTTCPECGNLVSKNYSAFLRDQTEQMESKVGRAVAMIFMARNISEVVSDEESFKKKKK